MISHDHHSNKCMTMKGGKFSLLNPWTISRAMSPLRRLLRSVRALARPPWRLAALLGRPLRRFHPKLQRVVRIPGGIGHQLKRREL
jgi:hypothetical protein